MKTNIRSGIFVASDDNFACFITSYNLYKDASYIQDIKSVSFEGARCSIYTTDYNNVHPFVKSLLSANYIGEFKVTLVDSGDLKEDVTKPMLAKLLSTNNAIIQAYGSLYTPKGYETANATDPSKIDVYVLDPSSIVQSKQIFETQQYNIRGRKLVRHTSHNLRQV